MNPSQGGTNGYRRRHSPELVEVLTRWMNTWTTIFPYHPVTELQIKTYLKLLSDMNPEILETACFECTRTTLRFPTPGDIHAAGFSRRETGLLGPRRPTYLDEPRLTPEEREEILRETSPALRKKLGIVPKSGGTRPQSRSIVEQKETLKEKHFL